MYELGTIFSKVWENDLKYLVFYLGKKTLLS